MVLPDRTWAVDGGARLPRVPSVRQARLGDAMTRPSPRKVGKARGRKAAPPVWLLISKGGSVGETFFHPRYAKKTCAEWNAPDPWHAWEVVKYVPSLPRKAGARRGK